MKAIININGQISGNFKLVNAISTHDSIKKDIGFNNFQLIFRTKREAKKALSEGFKYLKRNEPEYVRKDDYSAKNGTLYYDASSAKIIIMNNYNH